MKNLIQGILEFRASQLAEQKVLFSKLALGQKPDALFIACSDSRVVPNVFASTKPGDLLVQRCVGNMVPPCDSQKCGHSEGAAIEFSIKHLNIRDIIVCGHSECGAMISIVQNAGIKANNLDERSYFRSSLTTTEVPKTETPFLNQWLKNGYKAMEIYHGMDAKERDRRYPVSSPSLSFHNQIAQINVQNQIENLMTYPVVKEAIEQNALKIHGWYFDIASCSVYSLLPKEKIWAVIDDQVAPKILDSLRNHSADYVASIGK